MSPPLVVALVGPTGVGKTAVSLALASRAPLEIVSGDSRQIYRGLDAGTGKPTARERASAPHHLFDWLEVTERPSAGRYARAAAPVLEDIARRGHVPLVVGGSGLYLRALSSGLAPIPDIPVEVRHAVRRTLDRIGSPALHAELAALDPSTASRLAPGDTQRVARALEVFRATGKTLSSWLREPRLPLLPAGTRWLYYGLTRERSSLYRDLDRRTTDFFEDGILEELARFRAGGVPLDAPAFASLGYAQGVALLRGESSREAAIRSARQETRRYAKRQMTWWRKEGPRVGMEWHSVDGNDLPALAERLLERLRPALASP